VSRAVRHTEPSIAAVADSTAQSPQVLAESRPHADIVARWPEPRSALVSSSAPLPARTGETYVGTVVGERVLQGLSTWSIATTTAQSSSTTSTPYRWPPSTSESPSATSVAAYAAFGAATERVARCVLLFLSPIGAVERTVGHQATIALVRHCASG
jgi:hypothetical protein